MQLLNYLNSCVKNIVDGNVVDVIYLDFAKAFDTVPHRRLIGKLESYGFSGNLLGWISDFLRERSHIVSINGAMSASAYVINGIPQGSVLGPALFVIYINDILDNIASDGFMFADDTEIFKRIASRNDMHKLEDWSRTWGLDFNSDKCHMLTMGKFEDTKHTHRYTVYKQEMEHVFEEKDLGVTFDAELTFAEHIMTKARKANAIVGLTRRSFAYLDSKSFTNLYTSFVRPHLEYAQCVWAPHLLKHVEILEKVQMRGFGNLDYPERLKRLNLPTLVYRRKRGDVIELYKHFISLTRL